METQTETIQLSDYTEAYANPGEDSLIDIIHPISGLTAVCGETLEQVRQRYPNAERVNIEEFCQGKAARQDTPIEWAEVTEERYFEMLECLPPAMYTSRGFLVGEPWDHHALSGRPRYACFLVRGDKHFEALRPMTVAEFRLVV